MFWETASRTETYDIRAIQHDVQVVTDPPISQLKDYVPDFQVKNQLQSFIEEILVLPPFDKLFQDP